MQTLRLLLALILTGLAAFAVFSIGLIIVGIGLVIGAMFSVALRLGAPRPGDRIVGWRWSRETRLGQTA